ncbi:unnamed protein product [Callosobruchus maculatus]|uniref:Uncharacterized protein n=1 Tax=Callosobruchus maculatus TaxID=64391 RepID=A0A653D0Q4_CALMS|nr:unnamed protein product [Callosobruchus maculatus]
MSRSEYYSSLSGDIKLRCDEKMKLTDVVDPYALRIDELSEDVSFFTSSENRGSDELLGANALFLYWTADEGIQIFAGFPIL